MPSLCALIPVTSWPPLIIWPWTLAQQATWWHTKEPGTQVLVVNYTGEAICTCFVFPQSHCKYFPYIQKPAACLPSTNGGQKSNVSFNLSLSDCSAIYCPIKSTPALSLSSDLPLTICSHLPRGYDLLLSADEVSATLQSLSANDKCWDLELPGRTHVAHLFIIVSSARCTPFLNHVKCPD